MTEATHNPYLIAAAKGALSGFTAAALVDFNAFRTWRNFHDAYACDWPLAAWRWLQGIITGAVTGLGLFGLAG